MNQTTGERLRLWLLRITLFLLIACLVVPDERALRGIVYLMGCAYGAVVMLSIRREYLF